jgi:hypothetical protein
MTYKYFRLTLTWIFVVLPIVWIFGVHVTDLAKIFLSLFLISLLFPSVRKSYSEYIVLSNFQRKIILFFLIIYPVLIGLQQLARVYVGGQGINFAYHSQIVENFSVKGGLYSTLLNSDDYTPVQWITHHLNAVFYLPGMLGFLGVPGYMSLAIFEVIVIFITMFSFKKFLDFLGYEGDVKLIFITLLFCGYALRHSYIWGVEDEFFALPFIPVVYMFYLKEKYWYVFIFILLTFLVKESLTLLGVSFSIMAFIDFVFIKKQKNFKTLLPFIILIIISSGIFLFYFFGQAYFLDKSYQHFSKLDNLNNLFDLSILYKKFFYYALALLPFLFFPLWTKRGILLSIPVLPFFGLSFISGAMYNIEDYYSMIPTMIFAVVTVITLKERKPEFLKNIYIGIPVLLLFIAFLFGTWKPGIMVINSLKEKYITQKVFEPLPPDVRIYSSESLFPLLTKFEKLSIFYDGNPCKKNFDLLIIRKKERNLISDTCFTKLQEDENYKYISDEIYFLKKKK